jgi:hypothetical protein
MPLTKSLDQNIEKSGFWPFVSNGVTGAKATKATSHTTKEAQGGKHLRHARHVQINHIECKDNIWTLQLQHKLGMHAEGRAIVLRVGPQPPLRHHA